jgi:hypothetical protein
MTKFSKSIAGVVMGLLFVANTVVVHAQSAPTTPMTSVPTTKILAIGHLTVDRSAIGDVMPREVRETVKLYLGGKIDQWYVRQDGKGVVFLMNVASVEEAHALLEKLPLGEHKMMEFDFIPLGPLRPLANLLGDSK